MSWLFVLIVIVLFASPLWGLLSQNNLNSLTSVIQDPTFLKSLKITVFSSVAAAIASVICGLLFAKQFANYTWSGKRYQRLLLLFPYLIPNFILAIAFVISWNPTTGLLNFAFKFPFGFYGMFGMIFLFSVAHMPVAFLLFEEKIKRIDTSMREAARLSGAKAWQVFMKIELPLLRPTMISAIGLCFALNISAFAIPAWIGAPEHVYPLTFKIYQAIQLGGLDGLPEAASLSLVLFILALTPLVLNYFVKDEKQYAVLSGKSARLSDESQSLKSFLIFQTVFFVTQILFWMAPLTCLFLSTIVKPGCLQSSLQTGQLQCFADISFSRYSYVVFDLAETKFGLQGSLIYGFASSFIIALLSIVTLGILSQNKKQLKIVENIFSILLSTPGAIIALGLIVVCSGRYGVNLYNTPWIAVAAFVIKHMSLAFQPLRTGYTNISSSLIEAGKLSGAAPWQVWRKIVLPILRPEFIGGFFLVLIPILGELTMSVFLASPSFRPIGTVLFDLQDYADQASAGALAILLIGMILILNQLSRILSNGKLGY